MGVQAGSINAEFRSATPYYGPIANASVACGLPVEAALPRSLNHQSSPSGKSPRAANGVLANGQRGQDAGRIRGRTFVDNKTANALPTSLDQSIPFVNNKRNRRRIQAAIRELKTHARQLKRQINSECIALGFLELGKQSPQTPSLVAHHKLEIERLEHFLKDTVTLKTVYSIAIDRHSNRRHNDHVKAVLAEQKKAAEEGREPVVSQPPTRRRPHTGPHPIQHKHFKDNGTQRVRAQQRGFRNHQKALLLSGKREEALECDDVRFMFGRVKGQQRIKKEIQETARLLAHDRLDSLQRQHPHRVLAAKRQQIAAEVEVDMGREEDLTITAQVVGYRHLHVRNVGHESVKRRHRFHL